MPGKRQYRTTLLLLILILCCVAVVFYVRSRDQGAQSASVPLSPVSQGLEEALSRYENSGVQDRSALLTSTEKKKGQKAELVFWGMGNETQIKEILSILELNGIDATFFITEAETSAYSSSLSLIANSGYPVGIAYDGRASIAGKTAAKRAISDFIGTSATIQLLTGLQPSAILALTTPDEDLLAAAYASSLYTVMVPTRTVPLSSVTSLPSAEELLNELPRGAILCLQLDGITARGVDYIRQLCPALSQTDFSSQAVSVLSSAKEPAKEQMRVYTTERAAAFTFSGLGNEEELNGVLSALDSVKAVSTFFISADDLVQYPSKVQAILDKGHRLGIAAQSAGVVSAEALLVELMQVQESLKSGYGYTKPLPVRPAFGSYSEALRQACGAGGFTLLSAITSAVKPEDARETDPASVLAKRFPELNGPLQRGHIVHFQMNQYQYSNSLLGEFVKLIATQKNVYEIKPVMDILNNQAYTYTYPVKKESMLPEVRDAIYPGHLTGDPIAAIQSRYIGISWVSSSSFLPGFPWSQGRKLDKKGLVPNSQNMVFLTFDDWGVDSTVTAILDILRKHNASATFFVRTENVVYNPNLLRAIALEGHSIGSHSRTHYPLANDTGSGKSFTDLTPTQAAELTQDLVASYQDLQSIVGDISINGRPALTKLFRPPTLAVSMSGLTAVLDSGFTYSVSGSYTSQDYKATDSVKLANTLKNNTKSGAVLILHISDTSVHTAEALDLYLTEMAKLTGAKAFRFAALGEVLK
jgi:peptidoglycan/xylan/chitin deacetylase (PgdA/CDA1 family)